MDYCHVSDLASDVYVNKNIESENSIKNSNMDWEKLGARVLSSLVFLWLTLGPSVLSQKIESSKKNQSQKQINEIIVEDAKTELSENKSSINALNIEDLTADEIPEFVIEKFDGEKIIYDYLGKKLIAKQDGTIVANILRLE